MEHLESAARILFYARQLGGARTLLPEELKPLKALHRKLVETERSVFCAHCHSFDNNGAMNGHHATAPLGLTKTAEDELTVAVRQAVESVLRAAV